MRIINKTVKVYGKQQRFLESKAGARAFVGGIGSGKSFVGALDMIRRARPGRLYLVTAPTYPMLSDATFRSLTGLAQQLDVVEAGDVKSSPPPSIKLRTGAEVLFRSTDNPETLRGPNLSGVWMDEASLSKQEAFDILIGRLREGGEMGWISSTFTPKGKVHWTYKTFATGQPDTELIHAQTNENPFLPAEFVAKVGRRYTAQQVKQELGGAFIDGGGNHYFPGLWPRYRDTGDAYRIRLGNQWHHYRKAECSRLLTLDWAMGKPKKDAARQPQDDQLTGDCTAFLVADMTPDGMLMMLDAVNERIPMGANAPRLEAICKKWFPVVVCSDDDNLSDAMLLECRRYRAIPELKILAIGGRNKLVRSQAAVVRAERSMVYLPESAAMMESFPISGQPWVDTLSDQLASFTGADGESDDLADCMSLMGRLADEYNPGDAADTYESALGAPGYESDVYDGGR